MPCKEELVKAKILLGVLKISKPLIRHLYSLFCINITKITMQYRSIKYKLIL